LLLTRFAEELRRSDAPRRIECHTNVA
jgi:hypothetical protein